MINLSNAGKIGRARMWREGGGGERDATFSLRFPAHQDPFLISAPNLSRNRIEQQGEFGIFSKESFLARLRPRTKALYNLSPESFSGMQYVARLRPGHSIE
jgi:hypothetical protein